MTSLRVLPTHLRAHQALVGLRELTISFRISHLRGEHVDTSVSWIPNATDNNPRCPHFASLGTRTGTARRNRDSSRHSSARIRGSGTVTYQASLPDRPRQRHSQQNPSNTTSPVQPPKQITIIQTPSHKGRVRFSHPGQGWGNLY